MQLAMFLDPDAIQSTQLKIGILFYNNKTLQDRIWSDPDSLSKQSSFV